jgi:DNA replication protein DnaC
MSRRKGGDEPPQSLEMLLKALHLGTFAAQHLEVATRAEQHSWTLSQCLRELCELEVTERRRRRIETLLKRSALPRDKTLANFDLARLSTKLRRQVPTLCEGGFVERAENILAFGLPGRGKSHLLCAIAHEMVKHGYAVLFTPTYKLVQRLLAAKRDLTLERELRRLDDFDAVLIDDIGYVQQDREEMEVLFTFLSERYERRSVMITSNLVFSQWDRIFKDAMTTACAIDRIIHHSTILELTGSSFRSEVAQQRGGEKAKPHRTDPEAQV